MALSRGRPAVSPRQRRAAHGLLARGMTQGRVAERLGLSRVTIHRLANQIQQPSTAGLAHELPALLDAGERLLADPIRCGVCHALNRVLPCRTCRARGEAVLVESGPQMQNQGDDGEESTTGAQRAQGGERGAGGRPGIDLSGEALARYREIAQGHAAARTWDWADGPLATA